MVEATTKSSTTMLTSSNSFRYNNINSTSIGRSSIEIQRSLSFRNPHSNSLDSSSCHHRATGGTVYMRHGRRNENLRRVVGGSSRLLDSHGTKNGTIAFAGNVANNRPQTSSYMNKNSKFSNNVGEDILSDFSIHQGSIVDSTAKKLRRRASLDNSFLSSSSDHQYDHNNNSNSYNNHSGNLMKDCSFTAATSKSEAAVASRSFHSTNPQEAAGTINALNLQDKAVLTCTTKSIDSCEYSKSSADDSESDLGSAFSNDDGDDDGDDDHQNLTYYLSMHNKGSDRKECNSKINRNHSASSNSTSSSSSAPTVTSSSISENDAPARIKKEKATKKLLIPTDDVSQCSDDQSLASLSFRQLASINNKHKMESHQCDGLDSSSHHHRVLNDKKGFAMFNAGKVYADETLLLSRSHYRNHSRNELDAEDDSEFEDIMNFSSAIRSNSINQHSKSLDDLDADCHAFSKNKQKGEATLKAAAKLVSTTKKKKKKTQSGKKPMRHESPVKAVAARSPKGKKSKKSKETWQQQQLNESSSHMDDSTGSIGISKPPLVPITSPSKVKKSIKAVENENLAPTGSRGGNDSSEVTNYDDDDDDEDSFCHGEELDEADNKYLVQDLGASMFFDDEEFFNHHIKPHVLKPGEDDHTCLDEDIEEQVIVETMLPPSSESVKSFGILSMSPAGGGSTTSSPLVSRKLHGGTNSNLSSVMSKMILAASPPGKRSTATVTIAANNAVGSRLGTGTPSLTPKKNCGTTDRATLDAGSPFSSNSTTGIPMHLRLGLGTTDSDSDDDDDDNGDDDVHDESEAADIASTSDSSSSSSASLGDSFGDSFCDAIDTDKAMFQYLSESGSLAGSSARFGGSTGTGRSGFSATGGSTSHSGDDFSTAGSSNGSVHGKMIVNRRKGAGITIGVERENVVTNMQDGPGNGNEDESIPRLPIQGKGKASGDQCDDCSSEPSCSDSDGDSFCEANGTDEANFLFLGDDGSMAFASGGSSDDWSNAGSSYSSRFKRRNSTCMSIGEEGESDIESDDGPDFDFDDEYDRVKARNMIANQKKSELEVIIGECSLNDNLSSVIASLAAVLSTSSSTPLQPIGAGLQMEYGQEAEEGRENETPETQKPQPAPVSPIWKVSNDAKNASVDATQSPPHGRKGKSGSSMRHVSSIQGMPSVEGISKNGSIRSNGQFMAASSSRDIVQIETPKAGSRCTKSQLAGTGSSTYDIALRSIESQNMLIDSLSAETSGLIRRESRLNIVSGSPSHGLKLSFEGPPPPPPPPMLSPFRGTSASKLPSCPSPSKVSPRIKKEETVTHSPRTLMQHIEIQPLEGGRQVNDHSPLVELPLETKSKRPLMNRPPSIQSKRQDDAVPTSPPKRTLFSRMSSLGSTSRLLGKIDPATPKAARPMLARPPIYSSEETNSFDQSGVREKPIGSLRQIFKASNRQASRNGLSKQNVTDGIENANPDTAKTDSTPRSSRRLLSRIGSGLKLPLATTQTSTVEQSPMMLRNKLERRGSSSIDAGEAGQSATFTPVKSSRRLMSKMFSSGRNVVAAPPLEISKQPNDTASDISSINFQPGTSITQSPMRQGFSARKLLLSPTKSRLPPMVLSSERKQSMRGFFSRTGSTLARENVSALATPSSLSRSSQIDHLDESDRMAGRVEI